MKFDRTLFALCATIFLVPFMGSAVNLAMPQIAHTYGMSATTLTWVATIYLVSTAIFQIPCSKIADMYGRKKIYLFGIGLFSVTTFLCGFAPTAEILLALRFVEGIGSSMIFGTNMAILMSVYEKGNRGKVIGINTAVVYASLALGPFVGGMLTDYFGWQSLFFITGVIGILVMLLSMFCINGEWIEAEGEIFDVKGAVLYGSALCCVIYGFTRLPQVQGIVCLSIGIIVAVLFIFYEFRQIYPVLNVRLFSENRVFALSTLAAMINYSATSAIAFMLSLYFQYVRGMDARHAGMILLSQAVIQSVFALMSGRLSDKIVPSRLATIGMMIICIGLFGLIFLEQGTEIWLIVTMLLLLGIGFGIFSAPNTNVIMSSVGKYLYGQASATTGTARLIGQTFSLGIAGMVLALYFGDKTIASSLTDFMASMRVTFIVFLALCLLGIYASNARIVKNEVKE